MLTDQQFERLLSMKHKKQYFYQVADAAGVSAKTARKYLRLDRLPSQLKTARTGSTHEDAFSDVWPEAVSFLEANTGIEAETLLSSSVSLFKLISPVNLSHHYWSHSCHYHPPTPCERLLIYQSIRSNLRYNSLRGSYSTGV